MLCYVMLYPYTPMKSQPEDSDRSSKSNCWSSFKRHLRNSERRCERENEEGAWAKTEKQSTNRNLKRILNNM